MKLQLLGLLLLLGTAIIAQPASAAITVGAVSGNWTNVQPSNVVGLTFIDTGPPGAEEIRWGVPIPQTPPIPQSSFKFVGTPPVSSVGIGENFQIGIFTHFNSPLQNTPPAVDPAAATATITSARLDVFMNLDVDGGGPLGAVDLGPFGFVFGHQESQVFNPDGSSNGDDIVSLANLVSSATFVLDGNLYTLFLSGFLQGNFGNVAPAKTFSAAEGQTSSANIFGFFAVAPNPTNVGVPEPLSITLWGGIALMGFAAARRRRPA